MDRKRLSHLAEHRLWDGDTVPVPAELVERMRAETNAKLAADAARRRRSRRWRQVGYLAVLLVVAVLLVAGIWHDW